MFADYGDLAGNSAEAVSKLEESSAQTNAVTQPVEHDPQGNIQPVGPGGSLLGRLVQSLKHTNIKKITGFCLGSYYFFFKVVRIH